MLINNAVLTGSFIVNGVNYITNTPSTGSNTFVGTQTISGSTLMTGSLGVTGSVSVSGSITATGTLTAQTLVVQTVTSSIVYSSGSNIFGNQLTDVQQMTGSLRVTGSGNHYILGGNVGIGTTNPATYSGYTTLAINNATNGAVLDFLSNGTRVASINNGGASFDIETKTALAMAFSTSGSERMRITASGSVGIGTVSPENILTLIKNTTAATENTYGLSIQSINNNAYTELLLGASDAVDAGIIQTAAKNTNFTAKSLSLQPQGGNVLIGTTTNASYKLDVSGSGRFTGITSLTSATVSTSTTTGALVVTGGVGIGGALYGKGGTFSEDITSTAGQIASVKNGSNTQGSGAYYLLSNAASNQLWYQQLNASNGLDYWYNGSVKLTIASTGAATFSSGIGIGGATATTGGIQFPATQVSSADANNLDDYEEGTWTAVIGGSGGQSGQTYGAQTGYYTKIGRQVTVTFRVYLSSKGTITGDAAIKGLPFTIDSAISFGNGATYFEALATSWSSIFFVCTGGTTYASIDGVKTAAISSTRATTSDITNNTQFNGSFTYFV